MPIIIMYAAELYVNKPAVDTVDEVYQNNCLIYTEVLLSF